MATVKSMLQWRWSIIDEISMVSARLIADIDTQLRSVARGVDPYARDKKGVLRLLAGTNVLCSPDVWQCPSPDGGRLGDTPFEFIQTSRRYIPAPTIVHGQSLLWSDSTTGLTGGTEL